MTQIHFPSLDVLRMRDSLFVPSTFWGTAVFIYATERDVQLSLISQCLEGQMISDGHVVCLATFESGDL